MDLMAFLKQLVETEDKMARMQLVEDNKANLETLTATPPADGEDWQKKYNELQKKYIDTFFGGKQEGEEKETNSEEGEKSEEEKRAESITIDDLYKK
jgi:hypothetical protein